MIAEATHQDPAMAIASIKHETPFRRASNPFATRFTRPGAIPYLFEDGRTANALVAELCRRGWRGQIIGPHGSGKSTLLESLRTPLESAGRELAWFVCREGTTSLEIPPAMSRAWSVRTQVVVDGYEQLGGWSRWRLKRICRRRGAGLLVTTHESIGLPTLLATNPSREHSRRIVERLLRDRGQSFPANTIDRLFHQHRGNVRELLFGLYDLYERQRSASP